MKTEPERAVFVHPQGLCESKQVGDGTRIWAFAHVLPGASLGRRCNVCDHVFIENDVIVGNDVTLKCGIQLWDGVRIGDRVFVGPNATFTNDRFPRSKQYPETFLQTVVEDDVSIGANATILPGVKIGRGAMVGAGAVVTRDVPPHATVVGNPGYVTGFHAAGLGQAETVSAVDLLPTESGTQVALGARGCSIERLPNYVDKRGALTPMEFERGLPFEPRRIFLVHRVREKQVRGEHAHRRCEQFLVAVHGGVSVVLDDGRNRCEVRLEDSTVGLYLAPMVWGIQYKFDPQSVLMVAASHSYEPEDYIRDYAVFLEAVAEAEARV